MDQQQQSDTEPRSEERACPECYRTFKNYKALQQHRQQKHNEEYNQEINDTRKYHTWTKEELQIMAKIEASYPPKTAKMNQKLKEKFDYVSIGAIKGQRIKPEYKILVENYRAINSRNLNEQRGIINEQHREQDSESLTILQNYKTCINMYLHNIPQTSMGIEHLRLAVEEIDIAGKSEYHLNNWHNEVFKDKIKKPKSRIDRDQEENVTLSRKKQKKKEYKKVQELWKKSITRTARYVLDEENKSTLGLPQLEPYWKDIMQPSISPQ